MDNKRAFLILIASICLGLGLVMGLNALVDPYHILHEPLCGQPRFSRNSRFQNAGLINSYLDSDQGYDGVVLGTSLDSAYNVERIQQRLGTKRVLKLTIDGGTPSETSAVLEHALRTGKLRYVLWGVYHTFANAQLDIGQGKFFPYDLYLDRRTKNGLNGLLSYLSSVSVLKDSFDVATARSNWSTQIADNYDDWMRRSIREKDFERFNTPENLANIQVSLSDGKAALAQARQRLALAAALDFPALDKHLVQVVLRHPEVRFDLVIPPVSALYFHNLSADDLLRQMGMRLHLVQVLGRTPNVRIFAFDDDVKITENLANYKDAMHVSFHGNDRVVDQIAEGLHRLTPENVGQYAEGLLKRLQLYQVYSNREHSLWR